MSIGLSWFVVSLAVAVINGDACEDAGCVIDRHMDKLEARPRVWRSPLGAERQTLQEAAFVLMGHAAVCTDSVIEEQDRAVRPSGFRVERWEVADKSFVWLREEGGNEHGSGLLVVRCGPAQPLLMQVPHAIDHPQTTVLVMELFGESAVRGLQLSTMGRFESARTEHPKEDVHPADVAAEPGSLFHAIAVGVAAGDLSLNIVQFGLSEQDNSLMAGRSGRRPASLARALKRVLENDPLRIADASWANAQFRAFGRDSRFVRLELSSASNRRLRKSKKARRRLVAALRGAWW